MEYTITDQGGATATVDAENWLSALALGLPRLGVDPDELGEVLCTPDDEGGFTVHDALSGRTWIVAIPEDVEEPAPSQLPAATYKPAPAPPPPPPPPAPEIKVMISSRSQSVEEPEPERPRPEEPAPAAPSGPPPSLSMPVRSSFAKEVQESLAERLFDLSMDFATMEADEACNTALRLVVETVPCEAASVLRGTLNDDCLTFVAATGPVADQIVGRTLPFGEGLAGTSFDLRENMVVPSVADSFAHRKDFDERTGFRTRAALCVPILDDEGMVYGVIQLLNPLDHAFNADDEEAIETIARTLAGALANA